MLINVTYSKKAPTVAYCLLHRAIFFLIAAFLFLSPANSFPVRLPVQYEDLANTFQLQYGRLIMDQGMMYWPCRWVHLRPSNVKCTGSIYYRMQPKAYAVLC